MDNKKADDAAKDLFDLLSKSPYATQVSTVGTMVFIPAVLAGAYRFRTFKVYSPDLKPGAVMLSEEANTESLKLFDTLGYVLSRRFGIKVNPLKMVVHGRVDNYIKTDALNVLNLYLKEMDEIARKNGLDIEETILACLFVCATIISNIRRVFDLYTSLKIAAFGFVAGCNTVPNKAEPIRN